MINFNNPLNDNTVVNLLYWGSFNRFCGSLKLVNWFPGYYETQALNIRMLPFFLANILPTQIYFYKFDLYSATTAVNEVGTHILTLGGTLTS